MKINYSTGFGILPEVIRVVLESAAFSKPRMNQVDVKYFFEKEIFSMSKKHDLSVECMGTLFFDVLQYEYKNMSGKNISEICRVNDACAAISANLLRWEKVPLWQAQKYVRHLDKLSLGAYRHVKKIVRMGDGLFTKDQMDSGLNWLAHQSIRRGPCFFKRLVWRGTQLWARSLRLSVAA